MAFLAPLRFHRNPLVKTYFQESARISASIYGGEKTGIKVRAQNGCRTFGARQSAPDNWRLDIWRLEISLPGQ